LKLTYDNLLSNVALNFNSRRYNSALCYGLDLIYPENRPIERFWFLETVARMPYFSYNTMLTLYEMLGWWRRGRGLHSSTFQLTLSCFGHTSSCPPV
jgi:hypothetical protein